MSPDPSRRGGCRRRVVLVAIGVSAAALVVSRPLTTRRPAERVPGLTQAERIS
jgi:hypothetical protein